MADINANEVQVVAKLAEEFLPIILQYGLPLVEKVFNMIKGDPKIPAEALSATIAARLDEAAKNDQAVLAETK